MTITDPLKVLLGLILITFILSILGLVPSDSKTVAQLEIKKQSEARAKELNIVSLTDTRPRFCRHFSERELKTHVKTIQDECKTR